MFDLIPPVGVPCPVPVLPTVFDDSLSYYELLAKLWQQSAELTALVNSETAAVNEIVGKINDEILPTLTQLSETVSAINIDIGDITAKLATVTTAGTVLPENSDLNAITEFGHFQCSASNANTCANRPLGEITGGFGGVNIPLFGERFVQIVGYNTVSGKTSKRLFLRFYYSSGFTEWTEIQLAAPAPVQISESINVFTLGVGKYFIPAALVASCTNVPPTVLTDYATQIDASVSVEWISDQITTAAADLTVTPRKRITWKVLAAGADTVFYTQQIISGSSAVWDDWSMVTTEVDPNT